MDINPSTITSHINERVAIINDESERNKKETFLRKLLVNIQAVSGLNNTGGRFAATSPSKEDYEELKQKSNNYLPDISAVNESIKKELFRIINAWKSSGIKTEITSEEIIELYEMLTKFGVTNDLEYIEMHLTNYKTAILLGVKAALEQLYKEVEAIPESSFNMGDKRVNKQAYLRGGNLVLMVVRQNLMHWLKY